MVVELIGGPLDGTVICGASHMPFCVSLPTDTDEVRAVYQAPCGCRCHRFADGIARYYFAGYDVLSNIYKFPQQDQYHGSNFEDAEV